MDLYQFLMIILLCIFTFILLAGALWFLMQKRNTLAKSRLLRAEAINRLVDKFGTAKEVVEFLKTDQGRKLLEDPAPPPVSPRVRLIRLIQSGGVTLFLGLACFLNAFRMRDTTDINNIRKAVELQDWGTFLVAIGLGLLAVAYVTGLLVKRWGLNGGRKLSEQ
jgi:hypothetical protein